MTLAERLLATILGALVVWIVTNVVAHYLRRVRLRAALLTDIQMHLAGVAEQRRAVTRLVESQVTAGKKLSFPINYTVGEYLFYRSVQGDLLRFLSRSELKKVVKFYQALWELDVSINGLAHLLGEWEERQLLLGENQVSHIEQRCERIESFCEVLCSRTFKKLQDLPEDYRSVRGAETVFT